MKLIAVAVAFCFFLHVVSSFETNEREGLYLNEYKETIKIVLASEEQTFSFTECSQRIGDLYKHNNRTVAITEETEPSFNSTGESYELSFLVSNFTLHVENFDIILTNFGREKELESLVAIQSSHLGRQTIVNNSVCNSMDLSSSNSLLFSCSQHSRKVNARSNPTCTTFIAGAPTENYCRAGTAAEVSVESGNLMMSGSVACTMWSSSVTFENSEISTINILDVSLPGGVTAITFLNTSVETLNFSAKRVDIMFDASSTVDNICINHEASLTLKKNGGPPIQAQTLQIYTELESPTMVDIEKFDAENCMISGNTANGAVVSTLTLKNVNIGSVMDSYIGNFAEVNIIKDEPTVVAYTNINFDTIEILKLISNSTQITDCTFDVADLTINPDSEIEFVGSVLFALHSGIPVLMTRIRFFGDGDVTMQDALAIQIETCLIEIPLLLFKDIAEIQLFDDLVCSDKLEIVNCGISGSVYTGLDTITLYASDLLLNDILNITLMTFNVIVTSVSLEDITSSTNLIVNATDTVTVFGPRLTAASFNVIQADTIDIRETVEIRTNGTQLYTASTKLQLNANVLMQGDEISFDTSVFPSSGAVPAPDPVLTISGNSRIPGTSDVGVCTSLISGIHQINGTFPKEVLVNGGTVEGTGSFQIITATNASLRPIAVNSVAVAPTRMGIGTLRMEGECTTFFTVHGEYLYSSMQVDEFVPAVGSAMKLAVAFENYASLLPLDPLPSFLLILSGLTLPDQDFKDSDDNAVTDGGVFIAEGDISLIAHYRAHGFEIAIPSPTPSTTPILIPSTTPATSLSSSESGSATHVPSMSSFSSPVTPSLSSSSPTNLPSSPSPSESPMVTTTGSASLSPTNPLAPVPIGFSFSNSHSPAILPIRLTETSTPSPNRENEPFCTSIICSSNESEEFVVPGISPSGVPIIINQPNIQLLEIAENRQDVSSVVIDVRLVDGSDDIGGDVEICLKRDDRLHPDTDEEDLCLGYLDENESPPKWKCEDRCLDEEKDMFCGKTDHFTNFALLLGGKGSSSACDSSNYYITGSALGDMMLVLAFVLAAIVFFSLIFCLSSIGPCRKIFLGSEGYRIAQTRKLGSSSSGVEVTHE